MTETSQEGQSLKRQTGLSRKERKISFWFRKSEAVWTVGEERQETDSEREQRKRFGGRFLEMRKGMLRKKLRGWSKRIRPAKGRVPVLVKKGTRQRGL